MAKDITQGPHQRRSRVELTASILATVLALASLIELLKLRLSSADGEGGGMGQIDVVVSPECCECVVYEQCCSKCFAAFISDLILT